MTSRRDARSDGSGKGKDPAWKYCLPVEGNKQATVCKYCNLIIMGGGITRFKLHLSHTDPQKNSRPCPNVPPEVKEEIRNLIRAKEIAKGKRAAKMDDIRAELRSGLYDDDDDDEEDDHDDDLICYPSDLHPSQRNAYRDAIRQSKASAWEQQQTQNFRGSKRGTSSRATDIPSSQFRRSQSNSRELDYDPAPAPSLYKSSYAKQRRVKNIFSGLNLKEKLNRMTSKFFIYENVPPAKAVSPHFKNMIQAAQESGVGEKPPTPYEIKNKYLDMEYSEMKVHVDAQKEKWKSYGCTIMTYGWTGPTKLSIINFMVYSKGSTVFLKSVDSSNKIKDHKYIYDLLKEVVREVGRKNVVQVVTDNGSAFLKAGKKLMEKYNL